MDATQVRPETTTHTQANDAVIPHTSAELPPPATVAPQASGSCPTCAAAAQAGSQANPPSLVYVIGHIEPRFPQLSVEKEAWQATAREAGAAKDADRPAMQKVLSDPNNRYLVRQLCWVLLVQGIETYILVPRDPADYQLLVNAYRAEPKPGDLELVIGFRGPIANPSMCNGLLVPIVAFDQIYPFDRDSLLKSLQAKEGDGKNFKAAAGEMFDRIMHQSDNAGATDADRALNYLAVRYSQIYATAASEFSKNSSFTSIDVLPSPLSGTRKILDVVFSFTARDTDVVSKHFLRVDVTEEFPFLVTKLSPYFDR
jgi:hypothetical protein